jgi:integrase/recombinase XerD
MMDGVESYLVYLRAKGYTEGTIRWQCSHLTRFRQYLLRHKVSAFTDVTAELIESYLSHLKRDGVSVRTRQAHLSAIKGFYLFMVRQNLIPNSPAEGIKPPKEGVSLPVILTPDEVMKILLTPNIRTPIGLRDRSILELLYSTGIRRQELVNLNLIDLDLERGYLQVIQGKNRKDRVVPVGFIACTLLEAYIKLARWGFAKDPKETALFVDSQKGKRLSKNTVTHIVSKVVHESGVKKKVSPHTFRHTMATHMLKNDADIRYIQAILGHASVATTEIYTRLEIEDLKAAVRRAERKNQD